MATQRPLEDAAQKAAGTGDSGSLLEKWRAERELAKEAKKRYEEKGYASLDVPIENEGLKWLSFILHLIVLVTAGLSAGVLAGFWGIVSFLPIFPLAVVVGASALRESHVFYTGPAMFCVFLTGLYGWVLAVEVGAWTVLPVALLLGGVAYALEDKGLLLAPALFWVALFAGTFSGCTSDAPLAESDALSQCYVTSVMDPARHGFAAWVYVLGVVMAIVGGSIVRFMKEEKARM